MAGRRPDKERILLLLAESDTQSISNLRVKSTLDLSDERYLKLREELLSEGLVEKYKGRGGSIRLTKKAQQELPSSENVPKSSVEKERDLYRPFADLLKKQSEEDEILSVICPTFDLKAKGKWQNPDFTQIAFESYRYLRKVKTQITTYELKQFNRWDSSAVFEAASHHRFSHRSMLVLEWPAKYDFDPSDPKHKLDSIFREARRFGVGIATITPHYKSYRMKVQMDPEPQTPTDQEVDEWLGYAFSRLDNCAKEFESVIASFDNSYSFD